MMETTQNNPITPEMVADLIKKIDAEMEHSK